LITAIKSSTIMSKTILYLGNHQEMVEYDDNDIIYVTPDSKATGRIELCSDKEAYRVTCWKDLERSLKYFYFSNSKKVQTYEKEVAKELADEWYAKNNTNSFETIIEIKAKDITAEVVKNFTFVQPLIEYPSQNVPLPGYFTGCWLGDGTTSIYHQH